MSSRLVAIGGVLIGAAAVSYPLFSYLTVAPDAPPNLPNPTMIYPWSPTVQFSGAEWVLEELSSRALYYFRLFTSNTELWIYASLAVFGVLMMAVAIGSARSGPASVAPDALELLKQEKERAENLARLKSEFLNQVSHELRTPLAVIMGYIECMTDGLYGQLEPKHQEILETVAKQSSHLKNMIDQILIYSRLEANKQPVKVEEFSVQKVLADLRETFEFLCRQKGLELEWEIARDVPEVKNDPERFKEIASNLLQNALKYTDHGSVLLAVRNVPASNAIALEVRDTGIGIAENHLATIFEPFIQVHKTSTENSRGGIGLGLSIVKKHVEQLNGKISVESQIGQGTTFRVIIPRSLRARSSRRSAFLRFLRRPFAGGPSSNGSAVRAPARAPEANASTRASV